MIHDLSGTLSSGRESDSADPPRPVYTTGPPYDYYSHRGGSARSRGEGPADFSTEIGSEIPVLPMEPEDDGGTAVWRANRDVYDFPRLRATDGDWRRAGEFPAPRAPAGLAKQDAWSLEPDTKASEVSPRDTEPTYVWAREARAAPASAGRESREQRYRADDRAASSSARTGQVVSRQIERPPAREGSKRQSRQDTHVESYGGRATRESRGTQRMQA